MNAGSSEAREVPVDVLPPVPNDAMQTTLPPQSAPPPFAGLRTFYHPASGVIILGLDWLAFGTDLLTDFLALPVICVLAFLASFPLVFAAQRHWSKDAVGPALGKAFLGAFLVGLPFPITGTFLGAAILVLSGLPHHPVDIAKKLASSATAPK